MAAQVWNKVPFFRLLTALIAGIVLQWYLQFSLVQLGIVFSLGISIISLYSFTTLRFRYRLSVMNGMFVYVLLAASGGILVWLHDCRNEANWAGHYTSENVPIVVTLEEPLIEKANSYKALASFHTVYYQDSVKRIEGKIILYFKKDSLAPTLQYGDQLVFTTPLQQIKNAGNPGSFDYKTYCLFQGITHQVYLAKEDYFLLPTVNKNWFIDFIYKSRNWVVSTLRKYISGDKEQGLAEALLIGYKDDLDKNLIQAYSNTGVVHIIAISGLHLGLIYWLLLFVTRPLKRFKKSSWLRLLVIIVSLWLFSILAGAQPSVLRSALMFTIIAIGEVAVRRSNILNTLAFSAFVLLCINPFWLWDVGFQLSYAAVLSIIIFFRPVYNWYRPENKLMDFLWKLTAVTIAAQIFTLPVSIYHFHQMPLLFLFANFIAVPLSSVILIGEIFLCAVFFIPSIAALAGSLLGYLIYLMNSYVEQLDSLPFAVWNSLSISIAQTILLLFFVTAISYWLMEKRKRYARIAFTSFAFFMILRGLSFFNALEQKKLIVYNVPKHKAIDILNGRSYTFIGDSSLLYDDFARNFHLQPSRIAHRIQLVNSNAEVKLFNWEGKQVLLLDEALPFTSADPKQNIDLLVLSKNPKLYISKLLNSFSIQQIVIDGSVPPWKAALWKRDCDSLRIPCFNVSEEGAFVMKL